MSGYIIEIQAEAGAGDVNLQALERLAANRSRRSASRRRPN